MIAIHTADKYIYNWSKASVYGHATDVLWTHFLLIYDYNVFSIRKINIGSMI